MVPVRERLEHLVVLAAQLGRRRVDDDRVSHEHDQPLDPHAVGAGDQRGHQLIGGAAGHARQVTVQVPDPVAGRFGHSCTPRRNAIRSAISCGEIRASSPSGISDLPVPAMASMFVRSTVSSAPPGRRNVRLPADSATTSAGEDAAVVERDGVFEVIGRDLAVGVDDVEEQLLGGPPLHRRQVRADRVPPLAQLVAGHALALEHAPAAGRIRGEVQGGTVAVVRCFTRAGRGRAEQGTSACPDRRRPGRP